MPSTRDRAADKIDISPYSHGVYILVREADNQQGKEGRYIARQKDLLRR